MATKKCPHCGRKISAGAQYCVYCKEKFYESTVLAESVNGLSSSEALTAESKSRQNRAWLCLAAAVAVTVLLVIAVVICRPLWSDKSISDSTALTADGSSDTATPTQPLRDPARDAYLAAYIGYWVDEDSVGKKDLAEQGGAELNILAVEGDKVQLSILSYSGGALQSVAYLKDVTVVADDEYMMRFTFENDGLGHSGEGCLRFRDNVVDAEIVINPEQLAEDDHSLAINTVFKRLALPQAEGQDILVLTSAEVLGAVCGEPLQDVTVDEVTGLSTYTYEMLTATVGEDGLVRRILVDYAQSDEKARYRYDRIDGTMVYETVKTYFGEGEHDYTEQPTDIRVLHYMHSETSYTTFVFSAQNDALIRVEHVF